MTDLSKITISDLKKLKSDLEISSIEGGNSTSQIAEGREKSIRKVFKKYFPASNKITKGIISDSHGNKSSEIDLIILSSNHPDFERNGKMSFIMADETIAAIEIKGDLTKNELNRGLAQINSVKKLRKIVNNIEYNFIVNKIMSNSPIDEDTYLNKVFSGIICQKFYNTEKLLFDIIRYYSKNNIPTTDWIDFIASLDGCIFLVFGKGHKGESDFPDANHISVRNFDENFLNKFFSLIFYNVYGNNMFGSNNFQYYFDDFNIRELNSEQIFLLFNSDDYLTYHLNEPMKEIGFEEILDLPFNSNPDCCIDVYKDIFSTNQEIVNKYGEKILFEKWIKYVKNKILEHQ